MKYGRGNARNRVFTRRAGVEKQEEEKWNTFTRFLGIEIKVSGKFEPRYVTGRVKIVALNQNSETVLRK